MAGRVAVPEKFPERKISVFEIYGFAQTAKCLSKIKYPMISRI
jgi:hypothetical protein